MMELEDSVRYFTEETHIMPCLAVACGDAGRFVCQRGGVIDREGTPLTASSLFDLASLTKLFTGLAVMRLWEDGRLDLAAPVTAYAPQFAYLTDVTVDQVLGFEVALTTAQRLDAQPSADAARQLLFAIQPGPVTGRAYSDMHAMVLKYVIQGAAGKDCLDFLRRIILEPLHMHDTFHIVPPERRMDCVLYDGEHRMENGRHIVRTGIARGTPHDPKAARLYPDFAGHAGLFSTLEDMVKLCQGLLKEQVVRRSTLVAMSRNRTGYRRPDGSWQQYLGAQCYVKHPVQYHSEIPVYESDQAIGLSGFTGHHLSVDVGTGVFALFLGNRVLDRLTVGGEASARLAAAGQFSVETSRHEKDATQHIFPETIWSSVDYVHLKDEHFHRAVEDTLRSL